MHTSTTLRPTSPSPTPAALLEEHYPLARGVAARVHRHLPPGVDLEDLVSVALMGLMEACGRFDASRGVNFRTFAKHRMHGAILDHLRAMDWIPRSVRRRVGEVESMSARMGGQLGRAPSAEEVASRLDLGVDAVVAARSADLRPLLSLEAPIGEDGSDSLADHVQGSDEPADRALEHEQVRRLTLDALSALPPRERTAIELFYLAEVPLKRIGEELGVSESRACQLCKQGTQRLRKALEPVVG